MTTLIFIIIVYISEEYKNNETNDWKSYKITWEKLALYFSGNATPEEEEEIKKWVSDDPVRAEIFKML